MSERVLDGEKTCGPLRPVSGAWVLVDGEDYYRAFVEAAKRAESYILMAGWQFDSKVRLLRGDEAGRRDGDFRLLPFLEGLCRLKPALRVFILAWDYTSFYGLDREWFQDILFSWRTDEKIRFEYDSAHPVGASHHQKMVCIDGRTAFVGGMDICAGRWDDRRHLVDHPERRGPDGEAYEPYHDAMACVTGEIAAEAACVFTDRWAASQGEQLDLPPPRKETVGFRPEGGMEIRAAQAALSLTAGKMLRPDHNVRTEIRELYRRAILGAESLIYIENQYFTSQAVFSALKERMNDGGRPPLQIVMILPREPHAAAEKIAMGRTQAQMIRLLRQTAEEKGHTAGIFYTQPEGGDRSDWATYIHAKVLLVDDRFLTIGSANANNRSMGLDTELNISFEKGENDRELSQSLAGLRTDLLREHTGMTGTEAKSLRDGAGVAKTLLRIAGSGKGRLRLYAPEKIEGEEWMRRNLPDLPLDPDKAVVEEGVYEAMGAVAGEIFSGGIQGMEKIDLTPKLRHGRFGALLRFLARRRLLMLAALGLALAVWLVAAFTR